MTGEAAPRSINLALQGGGAHGAFTWGVLDALIEDGRLKFEAISGTSAGAMNAVVLADGFVRNGGDGAREALRRFWRGVSHDGATRAGSDIIDRLFGFWDIPSLSPFTYWQQFSNMVSPYGSNPLNINPLRHLLGDLVDFDAVAGCRDPQLFLSATNVRTGKIRVFSGDEVDADAVMASAALPVLFHAVEIGEEAYWDGGYMGNPALFPFFDANACEDILLIQVNPIRRDSVPRTASEIMERVSEITFNASLLREFRAIDFVNRLHDEHRLSGKRYRRNRIHRIDATTVLNDRSASTKLDTSWAFFEELHDAGREAGAAWLEENLSHIGERSTVDLRAMFS